tara:strand:- start:3981 stop:4304 length:324 start_codon:yes stop_codon:yes gene_type:complete
MIIEQQKMDADKRESEIQLPNPNGKLYVTMNDVVNMLKIPIRKVDFVENMELNSNNVSTKGVQVQFKTMDTASNMEHPINAARRLVATISLLKVVYVLYMAQPSKSA